MIKKIFALCIICSTSMMASAQDNPPTYAGASDDKGFKKENIFLGGSLSLGFASGTFNIGASPEIGYSIAQWLDAGLSFNLNYFSISGDYNYGVKQTSFNYGGGPFIRLYPIRFLFLQGGYEHNWIDYHLKDEISGNTQNFHTSSNSFLAGIGYSQRLVGQSSFYTALLFDLGNDINSPYKDSYGSSYPIIRAGFNIYLHPCRKK